MAEIYHILNRGIDKRKIFRDKQDYLRFIHNLFVLNNQNLVNNVFYSFRTGTNDDSRKPRKMLVSILAFCLMPNHYHLLLREKREGGIIKFMHKIGTGYVKYFNQKYKRKGTIFESRYKSILVSGSNHFLNLPYYIHLNPLDIQFPEWRDRRIKDYNKAIEYLNNYRWSSHLDYCGKKNFPSITNREFLLDVFGGQEEYKVDIRKWLKEMETEEMRELVLE
jgi:putative transposase